VGIETGGFTFGVDQIMAAWVLRVNQRPIAYETNRRIAQVNTNG